MQHVAGFWEGRREYNKPDRRTMDNYKISVLEGTYVCERHLNANLVFKLIIVYRYWVGQNIPLVFSCKMVLIALSCL